MGLIKRVLSNLNFIISTKNMFITKHSAIMLYISIFIESIKDSSSF